MTKLSHQQSTAPTASADVATKTWVENLNLVTAAGDYIRVSLSGDQDLGVSASGATITWDTVDFQRGDIALASNQISLKAGRTYWLQAAFRLQHSAAASRSFNFYNVTAASVIGSSSSVVRTVNETASLSSQPVLSYPFTPTEDTLVEVRVGTGTDNVDLDSQASWWMVTEIGATVVNGITGLEYMDSIEVTGAAVQTVTFGIGGDGALARVLDGDVDEEYVLTGTIKNNGGAPCTIELRPNGISTGQETERVVASNAVISGTTTTTLQLFSTSEEEGTFEASFHAKTGVERGHFSRYVTHDTGATGVAYVTLGGGWDDNSTQVTTLDLRAAGGTHIGIGSKFFLYRRVRNAIRADSASTYERNVEATVAQGTNGETEYTTGHATFQGSAIGVSASLNDTVTAGSITINLKVGGVTVLTATLDTTNTAFHRDIDPVGTHAVAPGDEIVVGIATTGLTTTGGGTPGITVNSTLVNDALVASTTGYLDTSNTYTKAQGSAMVTLVDGASVAVDASLSNSFQLTLSGSTGTLENPTNLVAGFTYIFRIVQSGGGTDTLAFGGVYQFEGGTAPTITQSANAVDLISAFCPDGTNLECSYVQDIK